MKKYPIKIAALHKMIKEEERAPLVYVKLKSIILYIAREQKIDKKMPATYLNIKEAFDEIIQDEKKHANYLGQIQRLLK